jgi:hypothetical protein
MFGPRGVNVMLVSVCEFRENWRGEDQNLLAFVY